MTTWQSWPFGVRIRFSRSSDYLSATNWVNSVYGFTYTLPLDANSPVSQCSSEVCFSSVWHYLKYLVDYLAKLTIWNVRIRNFRSSCIIYYHWILVSPSQDCFMRHACLLSYFFPNTMNIMQSSNYFLSDLKSLPDRPLWLFQGTREFHFRSIVSMHKTNILELTIYTTDIFMHKVKQLKEVLTSVVVFALQYIGPNKIRAII